MDKTICRVTIFEEQKAGASRYWQSRPIASDCVRSQN
jgi:hypothetical protein